MLRGVKGASAKAMVVLREPEMPYTEGKEKQARDAQNIYTYLNSCSLM